MTATLLPPAPRRLVRWMTPALLAAVLAAVPARVHALGLRVPNLDPAAIARGNAFVATADNPAALAYNAAGITQLEGHHFQVGSLFYSPIFADYESPAGDRIGNEESIVPVPHVYYTFSPRDSAFSFGLGLYSPFGLSMEWPKSAPFAPFGQEGELAYMTAQPTVAWQVHRTLSLSAGPTFNYSRIKLNQSVLGVPGSDFEFEGNDFAVGWTAGLLWQPHQKWSFGASYFSQTTQDYEGDTSFSPSPPLPGGFNSSAELKYPQFIRAGVSFRPTTNWNLEVNIDWTDWDRVDALTIQGVGTTPLQWNSSFFYQGGVTRYLANGYYVSAGYFFSEASTSETYFNPIVPDTDLHVGSLGVGRRGKHWDWAIAGQLIAGPWRDVDAAAPPVSGKYKLLSPAVSVSIGYHF
ncbi:MAG: hypothetical protein RJA22_3015 [Verrucomicrobiota bacterium]